jgi:ATP-binding cassette subfamily C protein
VVVLLIQCTLSFLLSPAMAVLALALLGAGALLLRPVLRRTRGLGRFASSANVSLADNTAQFLNGLKLALSQNLHARFVTEFRKTLHALSARQLKYVQQQGTARVVVTTLSALACALVFLLGYGVLGLDAAVLIVLLLIISRINGPVLQLQQGLQQLAFGLPAYEAMLELMEELPAAPLQHPRQDPSEQIPRADITLREASFLFPTAGGERRGIHRASFAIATGTWLGIAGESGAGKTTLADMLVGLVRPQSGSLSIGGRAVDEQLLPAWRAHLSYISQDPFLLHDSVRGNLQWADPAATEPDLWDALKLSGADEIVRRMPGGLDAMVGERGVLMSGGERQRIALARALLRKPGLLVMDEATNAIDISGERKLLQALRTLCPSMTVVMIAHRPETLACCDRIVRVVRGIVLDADVAQPPNNECRPVTLEPAS